MSSTISLNVVKMSAAGSGKTYDICEEALERAKTGSRVLITTYTNRGAESVRKEIRNQNCGVLHELIVVKTWFSFLMSDMIKPYQKLLTGEVSGIRTFDFTQAYGYRNYAKSGTINRYITPQKDVRSNEAASLVCLLNRLTNGKVIGRVEEVYSAIFFDEVQDLAGYDIEILKLLICSSVDVICCGDNKQATFRTHNTNKNKKQTGKNIWEFFRNQEEAGLIDVERNLSSRRFNDQICCFANSVFPIGDSITTIMNERTGLDGVYLVSASDVDVYQNAYKSQMLRYDKDSFSYGYSAVNYGACKGETFERVMIVPNKPFLEFIIKGKALGSPEKYYVAVTRAKYSIAIIMENLPCSLNGYEEVQIDCKGIQIRTLKYIAPECS